MTEEPKLSIVIPVFNEERNIRPLFDELQQALKRLGMNWEILWVDDGSSDASQAAVESCSDGNARVLYFKLTRNFGQSAALACGFEHAQGDIVVTLDGDRQNDPSAIAGLLAKLGEGFDVVCGWRRDRHDGLLRVWVSRLANKMISAITRVPIHDYGCTLRAYRRAALKDFRMMGDMHRLLPAYLTWMGLKVTEMPVPHRPRTAGYSKYSIMTRLWKVVLDAFLLNFYFSYITRPMHFFGMAGLGLLGIAFCLEAFVVFRRLAMGGDWLSPLFFLGLFLGCGALLFFFLGVMADLMARSFMAHQNYKSYHLASKREL
ncbi:MAG: glycosyltransferase family 2 protein [Elusimicrobia bacterium]|nr:glycosyltransferase family 2 protein [Elusimicrobiota bacterium]